MGGVIIAPEKCISSSNSNFVTRATRRVFLPAVFFWTRAERGAKTKWKGKKNTRLVSQVANIALCYNEVRKDRYHWDTNYDMVQAIVWAQDIEIVNCYCYCDRNRDNVWWNEELTSFYFFCKSARKVREFSVFAWRKNTFSTRRAEKELFLHAVEKKCPCCSSRAHWKEVFSHRSDINTIFIIALRKRAFSPSFSGGQGIFFSTAWRNNLAGRKELFSSRSFFSVTKRALFVPLNWSIFFQKGTASKLVFVSQW